ncbi:DUF3794 domain-containing protein [Iocasia frigidifontis]|uniref:DUF3794 domain-containing protein n=1 Tax=Iocasia fonsfrigidae TaxID=2682810 RepID=A0A8A7KCE7_9FIRM|nr:DUF3794 domain-containing protein [Iocasia fonsfrigidae]QTL99466.1 DUF3794 domain-containing protein [Iocasia fonsfrigidae]
MFKTEQMPVPAVKIRNITAEVVKLTYDIIPDKVLVQGCLHKQIFYVGVDNLIYHIDDDMSFTTFLDIPGAEPGMKAEIVVNIEKLSVDIGPSGELIDQKAVLEIFVKVENDEPIGVELSQSGRLVELDHLVADGQKQIIRENQVQLNQTASKIDEVRGSVRDLEIELIMDKVIIQGSIHKQIFFISEDNTALHQAEDFPFNTFIDLPGVSPGMKAVVEAVIEHISYQLSADGNTLQQELVVEFYVRVSETIQERIAPGYDLLVKLPLIIGESDRQYLQENLVLLEQPAQKIKNIVREIRDIRYDIFENKVIVRGVVHEQIYYIGINDLEYHQVEDVAFSTFLDLAGASNGQLLKPLINIEEIIYNLRDNNLLYQEIVLDISVQLEELNQLNILVDEQGLQAVLPVVIGENTRQILISGVEEPPAEEVEIIYKTIVREEEVSACQQAIIENSLQLGCPAIKIKNIEAEAQNLVVSGLTDDLVSVSGEILKDIAYVCPDNIVYYQQETIPFTVQVKLPEPIPVEQLSPVIKIENISYKLASGGLLSQLIVLEACVGSAGPEFINVVSSITGPGITTETILVREEVLVVDDSIDTRIETFPVVTDVFDPQGLLKTIIKETIILNVVGEGQIPVEVVVFVEQF